MFLAHTTTGGGLAASLAAFGTDWLYVAVPGALMLGVVLLLGLHGRRHGGTGPLGAPAAGAARLTGLPAWSAGSLTVLLGGLLYAVVGFFWDVAWHIALGRDEFLFSPPHVCLLLGIGLIGAAGLVGTVLASQARADVGWRLGRVRAPYGAAVLLVSGAVALVGFGVDELWHWAYGLDVTMWSPPHLSMISAAAFSPLAGWLLLAEAGPGAGKRGWRFALLGLSSGATLVALSAWQLEFDLGVPQWQQAFHPLLVALAAGFALPAARAALGPGGALLAMVRFVVIRAALTLLTAQVWGLPEPRFVPYAAAAVAVEAAFLLARRARPFRTALVAGVGVVTVGMAGAYAATQVWAWNPWTPSLLRAAPAVVAGGVAAAVLGTAFGRVVGHRPSGVRWWHVSGALAVVGVAVVSLLPRHTPPLAAEVRTAAAGDGRIHVAVDVEPAGAAQGADRFQVMAWQGGQLAVSPLVPVADGGYRTAEPVPVGGEWKTMVRLAKGAWLGAIPIAMPADPEIDAEAVPLTPRRTGPFLSEQRVLLREAHDGPVWPGAVGYAFVGTGVGAILALLVAGTVGLERRRRGRGWSVEAPLAGKRVLLTGAAGGIGAATRAALEGQGARVVGIDLRADRPETLVADLRDTAATAAAVERAAELLGGLDVVVANAGIGIAGDSTRPPDGRAEAVLDVNLLGAWRVIGLAMPHLLASRGQVVAVTSGLAKANMPYAAAYIASKRGLAGYADVLRLETRGAVRVSVVQPAYIRTPIHDGPQAEGASLDGMARVESVRDAAAAIVAACETGRRELGSSPLTTLELWFAQHFPASADRAIRARWDRVERRRPRPSFVSDEPRVPTAARTGSGERSD